MKFKRHRITQSYGITLSFLKIIAFVLFPVLNIYSQSPKPGVDTKYNPDTLMQALKTASNDSAKCWILYNIGNYYFDENHDSARSYFDQALLIAKNSNRKVNEAYCLAALASSLSSLGQYAESYEAFEEALKMLEDPNNENSAWKDNRFSYHHNRLDNLASVHSLIGFFRNFADSTDQQVFHFQKVLQIADEVKDTLLQGFASFGLAGIYRYTGKLDSALSLLDMAEQVFQRYDIKYLANVYLFKALIYSVKGSKDNQLHFIHKSLEVVSRQNNISALNDAHIELANYYLQEKQKDSGLYYAKKNVEFLLSRGWKDMGGAYLQLSKGYKFRNEIDSAYKYQGLALTVIDSVDVAYANSMSEFQKKSFKDQMHVRELEHEKASYKNSIRTNALLGGLFTLSVIAFFLFRNNRQKQKAKLKIEEAYSQLKSTQSQLIQSEKMASLGELTAGIAHEIQNPLNFVNNFSEVNTELISELKSELSSDSYRNVNLQPVNEIVDNIKENEQKVNHHGKRADAIVKGMLQHSRTSTGQRELTDLNALADEYLRLAYHGLRGKDNSFNVTTETHFDETIGKINIVSQDIGRVLLNLYNNAFYAVKEKKKHNGTGYDPVVIVRTKKSGNKVEITVSDNGNGIPHNIVDKIFQPFFTTKPTGQGTGLGLSLAYDIVKAHGGELKVESKQGVGSEFIIIISNS